MNREELIKLLQSWLTTATDDNGNPIHVIMDVDIHEIATEIIKSSLPPAEGAEAVKKEQFEAIVKSICEEIWYTMRSFDPVTEMTQLITERLYPFVEKPQPTAEGAEEILLSHPYLKVMYDDTAGEVCMVEQAIWAIERAATLHAQRIADKMVEKLSPSNEQIHEAALAWARDHSEAPDKDCPDWLIRDYEAGAYFVRQCYGCLNKTDNLKSREK